MTTTQADKGEKTDDGKGAGRFLLKLSGEAFAGGGGLGVDPDVVHKIEADGAADPNPPKVLHKMVKVTVAET